MVPSFMCQVMIMRKTSQSQRGEIVLNNLLIGDYTVTEKGAPHGYLLNTSTYSTTLKAGDTSVITITDEAPTGQITIKKSDTTGIVQGEASLEGAEYTVYDLNKKEVGKIITNQEGDIVWIIYH